MGPWRRTWELFMSHLTPHCLFTWRSLTTLASLSHWVSRESRPAFVLPPRNSLLLEAFDKSWAPCCVSARGNASSSLCTGREWSRCHCFSIDDQQWRQSCSAPSTRTSLSRMKASLRIDVYWSTASSAAFFCFILVFKNSPSTFHQKSWKGAQKVGKEIPNHEVKFQIFPEQLILNLWKITVYHKQKLSMLL